MDLGLHSSYSHLEFGCCCEVLLCMPGGYTTQLASVHWFLLSLLFSKLGWNPAAAAKSAPPGIGGFEASLVLAATAMCALFALGPTKPGHCHRQGAPRFHLNIGGVSRPHPSNDWWIPFVGLVIYSIYSIHLFSELTTS